LSRERSPRIQRRPGGPAVSREAEALALIYAILGVLAFYAVYSFLRGLLFLLTRRRARSTDPAFSPPEARSPLEQIGAGLLLLDGVYIAVALTAKMSDSAVELTIYAALASLGIWLGGRTLRAPFAGRAARPWLRWLRWPLTVCAVLLVVTLCICLPVGCFAVSEELHE